MKVHALEALRRTNKRATRMLIRAGILLQVHEGQTEQAIAKNLCINLLTVECTHREIVDAIRSRDRDRAEHFYGSDGDRVAAFHQST